MPDRTVPVAAVLLAAMAAAQARAAAPPTGVPAAALDLALEPVPANTRPGSAYTAAALGYAMVLGIDRTPKGRLWAAWIAGFVSADRRWLHFASDDNRRRAVYYAARLPPLPAAVPAPAPR